MIERTQLEANGGLIRRGIRAIKRKIFTPEFVRHCVTSISGKPSVVAKIKQRGTVHGICRATYRRSQRKGELRRLHPKGSHHSYDEYVAAADRLGEDAVEASTMDKIKMRRICRAMGDKLPEPKVEEASEPEEVSESEKKHHNPKFVRDCVAAITQNSEDLERVEQDAPGKEKGSPFAVCWAKYNKNKKSLAAKHSKGSHHTTKDYEAALKKLRESTEALRANRQPRSSITFDATPSAERKGHSRRDVHYKP